MKKLFIIGVAMIMCLALAPAAMAKVTFGGMIATDMYYWEDSAEANTANGRVQGAAQAADDFSEFNINIPQANNRFIMRYKNDEGNLTGYMELRGGDIGGSDNIGATSANDAIDFKYMWFDYKLNDMVHFRFGRQPQAFAVYTPGAAGMGWNDGFTLLANFGNVQVTDGESIKAYIKFNDMVRMEFQLESPYGNNGSYTDTAADRSNAAYAITQQNDLPRVDIALPISIANFNIEPAFTWVETSYENKAQDDNYTIWGFSLGAKAAFGPVTISAEGVYGENLGDHNYSGFGNAGGAIRNTPRAIGQVRTIDTNGDGINNFEDTECIAGWIQFAFNFGPATFQMAVGAENVQNDGAAGANDDIDVTRMGYAFSLPIKVVKNFTVMPAVIYLDRGDSEQDGVNNPLSVDYGDTLMVGVQFMLTF